MSFSAIQLNTPITPIEDAALSKHNVSLSIKRDDLIHPVISGNKYRKLLHNIEEAKRTGCRGVLTFGGAFSNHIHATAYAARLHGLTSVGVIRGEATDPLNPTLQDASDWGMSLRYISRQQYRQKNDPALVAALSEEEGDMYVIPEGGANALGVQGCTAILSEVEQDYDFIALACGTGTTLAGLVAGLQGSSRVLGFTVMKGGAYLKEIIDAFLSAYPDQSLTDWSLVTDYHFGGFARYSYDLVHFINQFHAKHQIQLEPLYTGKMMFGLFDLIEKGYFPEGSRILAIHTGGLQGIRGFNMRHGHIIV
jgi:1-aminocyclopropane-1-carboxylate deaminase/D-cysteine desulfhydrase-like pyridoxal-dependent ACC family enzyme